MDFTIPEELRALRDTVRDFVERIYRDARLYRIAEGTSEIRKIAIARHLLR